MKISIPTFVLAAGLSFLVAGRSIAQQNTEPASPPAASAQGASTEAAPSKANPAVTPTRTEGPKAKPGGILIDPSGLHVGNGIDIKLGAGNTGPGWFAQLIGLVAIVAPFATMALIFAIVLHFRHRRRVVLHDTLRAMIEKGLPIPPELIADGSDRARPRSAHRDLRGGLVLLGLGVALFYLHGKWGVIPGVIGVALLIVWCFERWEDRKQKTIS